MAFPRPDPPRFADGGDAWLESTPPVLTYYQARAGQQLLLALGVARVRAHSQRLQRLLVGALGTHGIEATGGGDDRGAFVVVNDARAVQLASALAQRRIACDARGPWLRLCPDLLTTGAELAAAAQALAAVRASG